MSKFEFVFFGLAIRCSFSEEGLSKIAILSFVPRLGFKILKGERGGEREHIVWKLINIVQGPMVQTGYAFVLSFLKEEFYMICKKINEHSSRHWEKFVSSRSRKLGITIISS